MSADGFTRKASSRFRKVNYAAIALIGALLLLAAAMFGAPIVFGPRGDLLVLVIEWLIEIGLSGLFAMFCWFLLRGSKTAFKWIFLAGVLLFGGICL